MGADLARFLHAQAPLYNQALAEIRAGHKTSHWMWFIFPQIAGLGTSPMAHQFAIRSEAEARAYLAHPVLGPRLAECTTALLAHSDVSAEILFGGVDAMKLRSSMTLFEAIADEPARFAQAIDIFCGGKRDARTLHLLAASRTTELRPD